jgi:acyl carrier protein
MQVIMQKIREGIHDMFPAAMAIEIGQDTLLSHIPDWDSMSSVNFKVFLEEAFGAQVPDELLEGGRKISEIVTFIKA